jgi:anti-sigma factor RsiW
MSDRAHETKGMAMNENERFEELSAFMDGELDAERSRFLMQRLAHDGELRARWERWQLQSGAMRRMAQPLPAGFADRVAKAIEAQPAVSRPMSRGLRWAGGAALAASLAVAATFVFDAVNAPPPATQIVASTSVGTSPVAPVQRTVLPVPNAAIKLPIPVRSGVVTAFRLPLHPVLQREPAQARPNFQPFPQPYAIDPELEAYLQDRKRGGSGTHDVFSEDAANNPARNASFPVNP